MSEIKIPKEHMPKIMNSLLCERLLGFERRLNTDVGRFEWRGYKKDGVTEWSEELLDFAGDLAEAHDLLQQYCRQARIGFNLIYDPRNDKHTVALLEVGPDGQPITRVQIHGNPLSQLIAASICGLNGFEFEAQHRALFPGHYLLLSS